MTPLYQTNWKPFPSDENQKPFSLTEKEISKAETSYHGRKYSIVSRRNKDNTYFVGAVWIDTSLPEHVASCINVPKNQIQMAVKEANRWMSKMSSGGPMSEVSRHRQATKGEKA